MRAGRRAGASGRVPTGRVDLHLLAFCGSLGFMGRVLDGSNGVSRQEKVVEGAVANLDDLDNFLIKGSSICARFLIVTPQ